MVRSRCFLASRPTFPNASGARPPQRVRKIDAANYPGHENMTCGTVGMGGRVANDVPRKVARHLHCVPELCTLSVYVGG